ncbi:HCNGP-like protein-domain-containing protein [Fusarium tricinctum]|uniref:HCNGP-like protein-domain-containing protein n=1 Tax=Fusarium tricinctum TaxID=61284 RepID=A0A8K0S3S8_9HYPO|nr:HCNGP-like protein-domain-containing protein [Fusarium tricinctum]
MAGLVAYASSDEEEDVQEVTPPAPEEKTEPTKDAVNIKSQNKGTELKKNESATEPQSLDAAAIGPVQQNSMPLGPSLPPMEEAVVDEQDPTYRPASPYSANRALLRDLTLPSAPNLDIPPSPPGSPPPGANKKFEQFLELKKKGTHFNAKLEQSSALKNPSLMDKLMRFVEVDERSQYSTTLPTDLWNPSAFPEWAFKDKLRKSHDKLLKDKEAERTTGTRTAVDFVPPTTSVAQDTTVMGGLSRGEKRKSGWN